MTISKTNVNRGNLAPNEPDQGLFDSDSPMQSVWRAEVPSGQLLRHFPLYSCKPGLHLVQKSRLKQCSQSGERHPGKRESVRPRACQTGKLCGTRHLLMQRLTSFPLCP